LDIHHNMHIYIDRIYSLHSRAKNRHYTGIEECNSDACHPSSNNKERKTVLLVIFVICMICQNRIHHHIVVPGQLCVHSRVLNMQ
jgi:hypothetical protein